MDESHVAPSAPSAPSNPAHRPRIVVADDHKLFVEGMRSALSRQHDVVAVAYTAAQVLDVVAVCQPDVLLLDLSMPDNNGLALLPAIHATSPGTRVVMVTMHVDRALADAAIRAGAVGFVPKDADLPEVETAIAAAMVGLTYLSPRIPLGIRRVALEAQHPALAQLTPREYAILELIGDGLTSVAIAEHLGITERAVTFHRINMRRKLGVLNEKGIVRFALILRGHEQPPEPPTL